MKIYIIMQSNGYGNSAVNSAWATKSEAEVECKRLKTSQERYDNDYYVVEKELQGKPLTIENKGHITINIGTRDLYGKSI